MPWYRYLYYMSMDISSSNRILYLELISCTRYLLKMYSEIREGKWEVPSVSDHQHVYLNDIYFQVHLST